MARTFDAEEHAHRLGEHFSWLQHNGQTEDAEKVKAAAEHFFSQFYNPDLFAMVFRTGAIATNSKLRVAGWRGKR